jgi:hypothetical protein
MSALTILAIALAALAFSFVVFVLLPKALLKGMRGSLEARVKARLGAGATLVHADYGASSFGVESRGALQWRGNGALILTEKTLAFFQLFAERELVIPLERIQALSLVHKHLGKVTSSRLLRVEFRANEQLDAVAFWVPKPEELKALIEARQPRPR